MHPFRSLALCLAVIAGFSAFAKKPPFTVRFYAEANARDSERFSTPVQLKYPPRSAYIEKTPSISERQIIGIYPFEAPDGSWGCLFRLDGDGRIALESVSTQRRGSSLVAFIGTKGGVHQVIDMLIDKPVNDGVITMQSGLTALEVEALRKHFKSIMPKGAEASKARG